MGKGICAAVAEPDRNGRDVEIWGRDGQERGNDRVYKIRGRYGKQKGHNRRKGLILLIEFQVDLRDNDCAKTSKFDPAL